KQFRDFSNRGIIHRDTITKQFSNLDGIMRVRLVSAAASAAAAQLATSAAAASHRLLLLLGRYCMVHHSNGDIITDLQAQSAIIQSRSAEERINNTIRLPLQSNASR